MFLEGEGEGGQGEFGGGVGVGGAEFGGGWFGCGGGFGRGLGGFLVGLLGGRSRWGLGDVEEVAAHVAAACAEDDTHVSVGWLGAEGRGEDGEEVEVGEVVELPVQLDAFGCAFHFALAWGGGVGAQDDHVETAGWGIVDPFGCKSADAVEGGEIDLFGGDEMVVGLVAYVFNVFHKEWIAEWVLSEQDNLGAALGQSSYDGLADSACSSLHQARRLLSRSTGMPEVYEDFLQ